MGITEDEAQKVYETYREAGETSLTTANFYTGGTSEKFVGEFIQGHRESVVLATKYSNAAPGSDPNAAGNHRKSMIQALEASLKRLQTDLHRPVLGAHLGWNHTSGRSHAWTGDIVRAGKVLYVWHLGRSRLVGRPGKYSGGAFEAGRSSRGYRSSTT